jgi:hypothetical protein
LQSKKVPDDFNKLLSTLLVFCQRKQPNVLGNKRKHATFEVLNRCVGKVNQLLIPLFRDSLPQLDDEKREALLESLRKQIKAAIYKPWLQQVVNYYTAMRI